MDENVIFSKSDQIPTPVTPQPQPPVASQQPLSSPTSQPQPVQASSIPPSIPQTDPLLPEPPGSSRLPGGILKWIGIVGGIVIILLIILFAVLKFKGSSKDEPVTLTYWGLFEDKQIMQGLINDFHRLHPTAIILLNLYIKRLILHQQKTTNIL